MMNTPVLFIVCCLCLAVLGLRPTKYSIKKALPSTALYGADTKLDVDAEDKLVWDPSSGRFYERDLEELCEEEFCVMDEDSGKPILLTREEKERIFLDTIQQYYYGGNTSLSDDQFNRLKEDLSWEGSALVTLNRNETLFMNAIQAWNKGKPIISDSEFDELKLSLKNEGSVQ